MENEGRVVDMLKNLSIRLKIALIYVVVAAFTLPLLGASFLTMRHLNTLEINAGNRIVFIFGIVYLVFLVVYISSLVLLGRKLTGLIVFPLRDLEGAARKIAAGDVDVSPDYESGDEIGSLAEEFRQMIAAINRQAEILSVMAEGDYTVSVPMRSEQDIMNLSINRLIDRNNEMLLEIKGAALQVSSGAAQIATGAQSLAQGATEQAAVIEEFSAALGEIAGKTKQNVETTEEATELSVTIKDNAEKGNLQMERMMQAVKEINEANNQINSVIKIIDDIAFQTNILALNAAVEAAHAGQYGKGFAVVAEEVRMLAAKSAEAARETGELIQNSIEKASLGLDIATETATSLQEIVDGIQRNAEIIEQVALLSDEQATSISQINTGIDEVAKVVQQNSATAEESAAASEEMGGQANLLSQLILQYKLKETRHSLPHPDHIRALPGDIDNRQAVLY